MDIDLCGWCCGTLFIIGSTFIAIILLYWRKYKKNVNNIRR